MFCSLFNQAGNVYHVSELFDAPPNDDYRRHLGPDKQRYIDNDPYLLLEKNLDRIKGRLRIQIWCGTQDDGHLPSVREFHAALLKAGVDHTYFEIEGLAHERPKMINQYRAIWFDYHASHALSIRCPGLRDNTVVRQGGSVQRPSQSAINDLGRPILRLKSVPEATAIQRISFA